MEKNKILSLKNVYKTFPVGKTLLGKPLNFVHAVNNVSFDVYEGETFSIVGESGSGKTTIGRAIIRIHPTAAGDILFDGKKGLCRDSSFCGRLRCALCRIQAGKKLHKASEKAGSYVYIQQNVSGMQTKQCE